MLPTGTVSLVEAATPPEGDTVMGNMGSEAVAIPSLTVNWILLYVPTSPAPGAPLRRPVEVLKLAQGGLLMMLKVSWSPSGSLAVGTKL